MKNKIILVAAKIQKPEEQLSTLKAEQMIISSKLYKKIEEVKNVNHEVEKSKAQLADNNIATILLTILIKILLLAFA